MRQSIAVVERHPGAGYESRATAEIGELLVANEFDPDRFAHTFSIHSCAGSLWNFQIRFGPAMTLR